MAEMTMNKSDLIEEVAARTNMTKTNANESVSALLDTVTEALAKGTKVNIPGFGSFEVTVRQARKGRNPQTGAEIEIPASNVVKFKTAKQLKEAVQ
jgi:DNA-binding protein HU-beta